MHPNDFRKLIREGKWDKQTSGQCPGYIQANLVILPKKYADPFSEFCKKNHKACPVLELLEPGETCPKKYVTTSSDIRSDLPKYRVFKQGKFVEEVTDVSKYWRDDLCSFLIGCSFSFEEALQKEGIEIRNITEKTNCSMYTTSVKCVPHEMFQDINVVVSMRPIPLHQTEKAVKVTEKFTKTHGGPCYYGNDYEKELGIKDIKKVDFGDYSTIKEGEVPMFWHCGVTSQLAARSCCSDILITHSPGHMFITDSKEEF